MVLSKKVYLQLCTSHLSSSFDTQIQPGAIIVLGCTKEVNGNKFILIIMVLYIWLDIYVVLVPELAGSVTKKSENSSTQMKNRESNTRIECSDPLRNIYSLHSRFLLLLVLR